MEKRQCSEISILRHIERRHRDSDATVGEGRAAAGVAHAVDDLLAVGGSGRDNDAARAHAEGEDAMSVYLGGKAVGGGR